MIRRKPYAFRTTNAAGSNILDFIAPAAGGWSLGATLLDPIQLDIPAQKSFSILGFSVMGQLSLLRSGNPSYGKLGKLLTAVVTDSSAHDTGNSALSNSNVAVPVLPLPRDASVITSLWDPAVDPLPPLIAASVPAIPASVPVSATLNLPQPLELEVGNQLLIGLWLMPSLGPNQAGGPSIGQPNTTIVLSQAVATIIYDDNRR